MSEQSKILKIQDTSSKIAHMHVLVAQDLLAFNRCGADGLTALLPLEDPLPRKTRTKSGQTDF
jgi:hypothetical protein